MRIGPLKLLRWLGVLSNLAAAVGPAASRLEIMRAHLEHAKDSGAGAVLTLEADDVGATLAIVRPLAKLARKVADS